MSAESAPSGPGSDGGSGARAPSGGLLVADRVRVEAVLDRMAAGIQGELGQEMALVGIRRRGAPLAGALADRLEERVGAASPVGELTLKRYADDLSVLHDEPRLEEEEPLPFDPAGRTLLVVDDVLYSGRTLLRATTHLVSAGAGRVVAAVVCSRGRNEVPLTAAFVGFRLDVGEANVVEVHVPPYEEDLAVWVMPREEVEAADAT